MAERDIAKASRVGSGLEFTPHKVDPRIEMIRRDNVPVGQIVWTSGEPMAHFTFGMTHTNVRSAGELEDILAEMHRISTDLNPKVDDMGFATKSTQDLSPKASQE